jgi:hypothetical protein
LIAWIVKSMPCVMRIFLWLFIICYKPCLVLHSLLTSTLACSFRYLDVCVGLLPLSWNFTLATAIYLSNHILPFGSFSCNISCVVCCFYLISS